jgi:hypothetical protein
LSPDYTAGWTEHNPDAAGRIVQLPDGVRIDGPPDLGPYSTIVGLWSSLPWEGDFALSFSTRCLVQKGANTAPSLDLYFGATGSGSMPGNVSAWRLSTLADQGVYHRFTRGAVLSLYRSHEGRADSEVAPVRLDVTDGTGTPKRIGAAANASFGVLEEIVYRWRLVASGRLLTLTQVRPDGSTSTARWASDLIPHFAGTGAFAFVVPAGLTFEITNLDVDEPDVLENRVQSGLSAWRFGGDPFTNWTIQRNNDNSDVTPVNDGFLVRAGIGDTILLWAKTSSDKNWRFSWQMTWNGPTADDNGVSGGVDFICGYHATDESDPNTWVAGTWGALDDSRLSSTGQGLSLRLAVQDALVPDRTDQAELAILAGDGTIEAVRPGGGSDLGFLPGVPYTVIVEKYGETLVVYRSAPGSGTRNVLFTSPSIDQLGFGWIGFRVTQGRDVLLERFDAKADPSRVRGGRLPTTRLAPVGQSDRLDIVDLDGLGVLASVTPGKQYVQTAPVIDLGGAVVTVSGIADKYRPASFRGGSFDPDRATWPVLRNGTLDISARGLSITGLILDRMQLRLRQGARLIGIEGNWFRGLVGGTTRAAVTAVTGEDVVDIRIAHNLVAPEDGGASNSGGFVDIDSGTMSGLGARRITIERNDIGYFVVDPDVAPEAALPVPIRLGRSGPDTTRNADIVVRENRVHDLLLPNGAVWIDSRCGGVRIVDNTTRIDSVHGGTIYAPEGRLSRENDLPFHAGVGTIISDNLFACSMPDSAQHGIVVGDGYGKVINNWSAQVPIGEQPSSDSAPGFGTLILLAADNDWRTADFPGPRNAGRTSVGGNLLSVAEGFGDGRIPPDGCVVAGVDPARADRNQSLAQGLTAAAFTGDLEAGPISPTDYVTPVPDADMSSIPVRWRATDVGPGSMPPPRLEPVAPAPASTPLPAPPEKVRLPTPIHLQEELPTSTRQIYVVTDGQYQAALDDLRPGDEVILAEGMEGGYRRLDKVLPFDNPATIRAEIVGASRLDGIDLVGANTLLHGIDLGSRKVNVWGDRIALFRCLMHEWADPVEPQIAVRGRHFAFGLCEAYSQRGKTLRLDGRHGARQAHVFGCLFRDCEVDDAGPGNALVEIVPAQDKGASLLHLVENLLFWNVNQAGGSTDGTVVVDGCDNVVRFVQLSRARSVCLLGGRRNAVYGSRFEPGPRSGGVVLRGDDPRCYGCVVTPYGSIRVMAGDTVQAAYENGTGRKPAATNAWVADCQASLIIGVEDPASPARPALGTTVVGMRGGWLERQTRYARGTILLPYDPVPVGYRETTVALTPGMVGARAPWPAS